MCASIKGGDQSLLSTLAAHQVHLKSIRRNIQTILWANRVRLNHCLYNFPVPFWKCKLVPVIFLVNKIKLVDIELNCVILALFNV